MTNPLASTPLFSGQRRQRGFEWRWNGWSTALGALVWIALVAAAEWGRVSLGPAECLFLLAPLVTIPLGLRLVAETEGQGIAQPLFGVPLVLQPLGALMVVGSFALPVGRSAGALAAGWLGVAACIGLFGCVGLVRGSIPVLERTCLNLGLVYLPFGGFWLVASRLGLHPDGFKEPIVFFTAVHYHYAAFAAPLLAGMTGIALRAASGSWHKLFPVAACSVMAAPALLAAGWALGSPLLKVVAAFVLAAGLLVVVGLTLLVIPRFRKALAGTLLVVSGLSVVAGMCLVGVYAGGEFVGIKLISIPQMTVSHGILNSLGFTLCGLFAWRLEKKGVSSRDEKEPVKGKLTSKGLIVS